MSNANPELSTSSAQLIARLSGVCNDPDLVKKLYPSMVEKIKKAGKVSVLLAMAVYQTIEEYVKNNSEPKEVHATLLLNAPKFIDVVAPNQTVADDAKQFLKQILDKA